MSTNLDVTPDETAQNNLDADIAKIRAYDNELLKQHFETEYAENKAKAIVDKYMTIMDKMEDIQYSENDALISAFGKEFYNDKEATIEDIEKIVDKYHKQYENIPVVPGPLATRMDTIQATKTPPQSAGKKTSKNSRKSKKSKKSKRSRKSKKSQK